MSCRRPLSSCYGLSTHLRRPLLAHYTIQAWRFASLRLRTQPPRTATYQENETLSPSSGKDKQDMVRSGEALGSLLQYSLAWVPTLRPQ